jgi:hypothetical protein
LTKVIVIDPSTTIFSPAFRDSTSITHLLAFHPLLHHPHQVALSIFPVPKLCNDSKKT